VRLKRSKWHAHAHVVPVHKRAPVIVGDVAAYIRWERDSHVTMVIANCLQRLASVRRFWFESAANNSCWAAPATHIFPNVLQSW
jgi:hypothetical protein